mmetsp:Transcript_91546/g.112117  ORF Transcript_91546/g.112117 Transcript_91546/m.112117 type:complete len:353 (-) Transcript_91546:106-1164(-)
MNWATAISLGALTLAAGQEATNESWNFAPNVTQGARRIRKYLTGRFGGVLSAQGDPALDPCPVLNEWPSKLEIDTPSPCTLTPSGSWSTSEASSDDSGIPLVMSWSQQCSTLGGGLVPVTSYRLPSGGLFGSTQPVLSLTGSTFRLNDCVGNTRFFLDEKVYQVPGEPDAHACEIYGSCDGTVFLQFIIRDHAGSKIAHTPYLRLFQSSFKIEDINGLLVAQVERIGRWNPMSKTCSGQAHKWLVKFPDLGIAGASPLFPTAADRWPAAQLVTIMSTRDGARLSSGLVGPSVCEMEKTGLLIASVVFLVAAIGALAILFVRVGLPTQQMCVEFEATFCRRRKRTPNFPKYTV